MHDPSLLQPLVQRISAQHPQIAQLLNENPQALYEILGLAQEGEDDDDDAMMGGAPGQNVVQVNLTEEEAAAVARVGLSWDTGRRPALTTTSWKHSALTDRPCCSATSRVTGKKSSPLTCSSTFRTRIRRLQSSFRG